MRAPRAQGGVTRTRLSTTLTLERHRARPNRQITTPRVATSTTTASIYTTTCTTATTVKYGQRGDCRAAAESRERTSNSRPGNRNMSTVWSFQAQVGR
eukprot:CAMPEP_0171726496 /NCGR_PEP_ID=MMETSP0991-20121206/25695_1 /TAXON_ID=483369 /ORGANISM="non described non described, Strain CCMP2098" /LENGTH=97 /DNA_ID=CAMNT_0012319979 /DNA_START=493 /DNA_END=782 /DNA_ORIENTATION=+